MESEQIYYFVCACARLYFIAFYFSFQYLHSQNAKKNILYVKFHIRKEYQCLSIDCNLNCTHRRHYYCFILFYIFFYFCLYIIYVINTFAFYSITKYQKCIEQLHFFYCFDRHFICIRIEHSIELYAMNKKLLGITNSHETVFQLALMC